LVAAAKLFAAWKWELEDLKAKLRSTKLRSTEDELSTRERLLRATSEVFAEVGYAGASVHAIARRANLTTGAIYRNFSGKDDLLAEAVWSAASEELGNFLLGDEAATQRLHTAGANLFWRHNKDVTALLMEAFVTARHNDGLARRLRAKIHRKGAELAGILDQAIAEGGIAPDVDRDVLIRFWQTLALGGLIFDLLSIRPPDQKAWERLMMKLSKNLQPSAD